MVFQVLGTDNQMNVDLLELRAGVASVGDEVEADRAQVVGWVHWAVFLP